MFSREQKGRERGERLGERERETKRLGGREGESKRGVS